MQSKKLKTNIEYWEKSAERSWKTAKGLFDIKRYDACLFFCHLTLEKMLKGLVIQKTKKPAPHIHRLDRLSSLANLKLTDNQLKNLKIISGFNIAGRYDNVKFNFYKIAYYLSILADCLYRLADRQQKLFYFFAKFFRFL